MAYFHVVFTLPHELASLALQNQRIVYGILFQAAAFSFRLRKSHSFHHCLCSKVPA
jgi:hypothetical protein